MYQTIIIDTVSIAWDQCEQFICRQNGVQKINEIPWGGGYSACKKEFENTLRKITMLGYGVVLIAHNASRIEKTADGSEIEIIYPDLPELLGFYRVIYIKDVVKNWNPVMEIRAEVAA